MQLSHPIEKAGFFWLPNQPQQQFPGFLLISQSGEVSLRLIYQHSAVDPQLLLSGTPLGKEPKRLLGIVDKDAVTLETCFAIEDPFYFLRIMEHHVSVAHYRIGTAFVGAQFAHKEPIAFSRIDFSFERLSEWFAISGLRTEIESDSGMADWSLHYAQPSDISIALPDGIALTYVFSPSFSLPDYKVSEISSKISQRVKISLISERQLPFPYFYHIIRKMQTFQCLAMNRIVSVEWIKGYSNEKRDRLDREIPTDIFYQSHLQGERAESYVPMVLCYNDISARLERTILDWFAGYDDIEPAFSLYLSSMVGSYKYLSGVFLSLTQGLETLHRKYYKATQTEVDNFEELRTIILEAVPPNRKNFVESKLRYANELSLRKRVKQLIDPFRDLYGTSRERESLVQDVVDVRNYLTHYDEQLESRAKKTISDSLYTTCLRLEALFQLYFLLYTGMSIHHVKATALKNSVLRYRLGLDNSDS